MNLYVLSRQYSSTVMAFVFIIVFVSYFSEAYSQTFNMELVYYILIVNDTFVQELCLFIFSGALSFLQSKLCHPQCILSVDDIL